MHSCALDCITRNEGMVSQELPGRGGSAGRTLHPFVLSLKRHEREVGTVLQKGQARLLPWRIEGVCKNTAKCKGFGIPRISTFFFFLKKNQMSNLPWLQRHLKLSAAKKREGGLGNMFPSLKNYGSDPLCISRLLKCSLGSVQIYC